MSGMTQPASGAPSGDRDADLAVLSRLDLNLLAPLHALLEERNVTRASVRVGLSQSAMSHLLRRCRQMFGDELLVRVGTVMEPTARARDLQGPLAVALEGVRAMVNPWSGFDPATTRRQITMAAANASAASMLPHILNALAREAPSLTLRVVALPPLSEDLTERPDLDMIVRASIIPSAYKRSAIFTERWVAIADENNPALKSGLSLDALLGLPHVEYDADGHVMPYRILEGKGLQWTKVIAVDDFLLIPHLLRGSDRIGVIQERIAREFVRNGGLAMHELPIEVPTYTVDAIWNPRRYYDPLKPWLTDLMRHAMGMDADDAATPAP